ncbi:Os05g0140400 [Oryza sativa Japonica Group]|uniref:Os05g0140400 protein n=1 Tax=Oryza sativa subsp. japonica TaxID=39947 RepID=A0A0P0WHU4_ORYSJ|nr:Os05g0140400 [Oryza sativa Japonica Group]
MGTTTRGPVTMRLYCFYAAALFILCFLLPAAVAEEMRSQMDGDGSEETVSDHGPPPLAYYYYDAASATMMTFEALRGRRHRLRHRPLLPVPHGDSCVQTPGPGRHRLRSPRCHRRWRG